MNNLLNKLQFSWWIFLLRGIAALGLSIMAFAWPQLTVAVLIYLFGAYVLIDGLVGLIDAIRYRNRLWRIWPLILESLLGIVVGLLTLLWPGVSALALVLFIAAWAILGGLLRIVLAFQIRHEITGEWVLILGGLLSILFGAALIAVPEAGLITLIWLIGIWAALFGILMVSLAFRFRMLCKDIATPG